MYRILIATLAALSLAFTLASSAQAQTIRTATPVAKYVDLAPGKSATDGTTTVTNSGTTGKVRVYYTGDKTTENGNHQLGDITKVKNRDATGGRADQVDVDTGGDATEVDNQADDATVNVDGGGATITNSGDNVTTNINGNNNTMTAGGTGNDINFSATGTGNSGNGSSLASSGDVDLNGSSAGWGGTGSFSTHN